MASESDQLSFFFFFLTVMGDLNHEIPLRNVIKKCKLNYKNFDTELALFYILLFKLNHNILDTLFALLEFFNLGYLVILLTCLRCLTIYIRIMIITYSLLYVYIFLKSCFEIYDFTILIEMVF